MTTPLDVIRAMLRHFADWVDLDDRGRHAAIAEELQDKWLREVAAVYAATLVRGFPVAAADLHPPLTWGMAWTARILDALATAGVLSATGERRNGWIVYVDVGVPAPSSASDVDGGPQVLGGTRNA